MTAGTRDELHRLLSAVCDGVATPADHQRLEALLRADRECRQFYLRYLDLHAAVLQHPSPAVPPAGLPAPSHPRPVRWGVPLLAVALAAAVGFVVWAMSTFQPDRTPDPPPSPGPQAAAVPSGYVATLGRGSGCRWTAPSDLRAGDRFPAGVYALASGVAEVRLDGGATLTLQGPIRFRLDSRTEVTVESGRVLFQADETAEPVHLRTARSEYLNLGTRYVMTAGPDADELHVFDGQVRRSVPGGEAEITPAGSARRYPDNRSAGREIPLDEASAPRLEPTPLTETRGLLVYEGFDYPGMEVVGPNCGGGVGWARGWIPHKGLPAVRLSGAQDLEWPGPDTAPNKTGGSAHLVSGTGRTAIHRYLKTPVRMDEDGTYYHSYRCKRGAAPRSEDLHQVSLVLRKWNRTTEQEILQKTTLRFALTRDLMAINFHGETKQTPLPRSPGKTLLVVGKVLTSRDRPDQVFMRVYWPEEPPPANEPPVWSVVSSALHADTIFDQVSLEFHSRADIWLGELRIGRTWTSVTHPDVTLDAP